MKYFPYLPTQSQEVWPGEEKQILFKVWPKYYTNVERYEGTRVFNIHQYYKVLVHKVQDLSSHDRKITARFLDETIF